MFHFCLKSRRRPQPADKWHLDEVFVTILGQQYYLWRAVDDDGQVIDILRAIERRILIDRPGQEKGEWDASSPLDTRNAFCLPLNRYAATSILTNIDNR